MNLSSLLLLISFLASTAAWIWLIVIAFRNKETLWGILLLVVPISPFVALAFVILKWKIAKRPAILGFSSFGVSLIAMVVVMGEARRAFAQYQELAAAQAQAQAQTKLATPPPSSTSTTNPSPQPGEPLAAAPAPETSPAPKEIVRPVAARVRHAAQAADNPSTSPSKEPLPPSSGSSSNSPSKTPSTPSSNASSDASANAPEALEPGPSDPRLPPVALEVVTLGELSPNGLRTLEVRLRNPTSQPVKELKLSLTYLDAKGNRLGRWKTIHAPDQIIIGAKATNEFWVEAYFVPRFTQVVRTDIEAIVFADDTRWPRVP